METWIHAEYRLFGLVEVDLWVMLGILIVGGVLTLGACALMWLHPRVKVRANLANLVEVLLLAGGSLLAMSMVNMVFFPNSVDVSESVEQHLQKEYGVGLLDEDVALSKSDVAQGVAVDVLGDGVVKFKSDGTVGGDEFVDGNGNHVDLATYRKMYNKSLVVSVEELTSLDVLFFLEEDDSSGQRVVFGILDGEQVIADIFVNEQGGVRDVQVGGESLF